MKETRILKGADAERAAAFFRQIDEKRSGNAEGLIISGPVRGLSPAVKRTTGDNAAKRERRRKLDELRRRVNKLLR